MRRLWALLLVLAVSTAAGGCSASSAGSGAAATGTSGNAATEFNGTIRIAMSQWVGYSGLWAAVDQGFFKKRGLDVQLTFIDDPGQRYAAVKSGRLEGVAASVDALARVAAQGIPLTTVYGLDTSAGGDGIVSNKTIATVADLKGQTLGVSLGSSAEWFVYWVLKQNGMTMKDVKIQNMTSGDAGAAFAAGKIPAAMTWEPWLTKASQTKFGHVLASSKDYPNVIADSLAFDSTFVTKYPATVKKFIDAVVEAHLWIRDNPDQAYGSIGKHMGLSVKETADTLKVVKLLTVDENKAFFGTTAAPGDLYKISDEAAKFFKQSGQITEVKPPSSYIDLGFVNGL